MCLICGALHWNFCRNSVARETIWINIDEEGNEKKNYVEISCHQSYSVSRRMPSSGVWRCVDLVWTDVSEELITSIFRVEIHAGSSLLDFSTLKMEAIRSSETSFHIRSTQRHIPEDGILHSHRNENLKSYLFRIVPQHRRSVWCHGY
jgi:hypothetical protein